MAYLPYILFTVITNAAAQIMLKYGMMSISDTQDLSENIVIKLLQIVFQPWVLAGLTTFVISMASHLFVLSKVELSFAYPFLSLAYVIVAVVTYFLFKEDLNAYRMGGIVFIIIGTILIAQSGTGLSEEATETTSTTDAIDNVRPIGQTPAISKTSE